MKHRAFITTYESVSFPTEMPLYLRISGSENDIVNTQLSSKSFDSDVSFRLFTMLFKVNDFKINGIYFFNDNDGPVCFFLTFLIRLLYYKRLFFSRFSNNLKKILNKNQNSEYKINGKIKFRLNLLACFLFQSFRFSALHQFNSCTNQRLLCLYLLALLFSNNFHQHRRRVQRF